MLSSHSVANNIPIDEVQPKTRFGARYLGKIAFYACISSVGMAICLCYIHCLCIAIEMTPLPECAKSLQLPARPGCNGMESLCAKRYNEVSYATMHNAFATSQDGIFFAQHRGCMRSALMHGIRGFMLDVHLTKSGTLKLCLLACWTGSVSLQDVSRVS